MTRTVPRVVCLGGGWSSFYCVRALRGAIRRGEVDVSVIGRDNFHTFHGFIAEMLTGRIQPGQITSPARRMFPPARFHNAEIEQIDLERKVIVTARHLDGKRYELPYDHLVVTLGSIDDLSRYPGLAEHALKLKTYWDCFKVRNHILSMLELAEIETDPAERQRLLTFVIVGGNYGGIEVAAELEDYIRILARKEYPRINPAESRVIVAHSGDRILPELVKEHPKLVDYAERYLRSRGLDLRTGVRLSAATPEEAVLSSGERIATHTIISSAGIALSPLLNQLPYERDDRGRLITDEFTRVPGAENTWAAPGRGIDVIVELKIQSKSILVTGRFDHPKVKNRCENLEIKLIPKDVASFNPIEIYEITAALDYVLIDNDPLVITTWKISAKNKGNRAKFFNSLKNFQKDISTIPKETVIYLDSDLGRDECGNLVKGEDAALCFSLQGFQQIFLTTGHDSSSFSELPYIKGIVGKDPI